MIWIIEASVFSDNDNGLAAAACAAGHRVLKWDDNWWGSGVQATWQGPRMDNEDLVVFHGSLGNADRIAKTLPWLPGAFCNTERFFCSAWYQYAAPWPLHKMWRVLPASDLVANGHAVFGEIGAHDRCFVRPDSPLKPFSGRVVELSELSLTALDHGFYYEDESLPVVVAPEVQVDREWRLVIADGSVVTGCEYGRERIAHNTDVPKTILDYATRLVELFHSRGSEPEVVYVMDICESDGGLFLLEFNPFSGADLYSCDRQEVVRAVSQIVKGMAND
jgi:hypothetical protein